LDSIGAETHAEPTRRRLAQTSSVDEKFKTGLPG
jgi:hypothetical protein